MESLCYEEDAGAIAAAEKLRAEFIAQKADHAGGS